MCAGGDGWLFYSLFNCILIYHAGIGCDPFKAHMARLHTCSLILSPYNHLCLVIYFLSCMSGKGLIYELCIFF